MAASKKTGKKLDSFRGSAKKPASVREGWEDQLDETRTDKPAIKKMKSFRLAEEKIRRARKILGTRSDTGTIEAALDIVIFRQELLDGLNAMDGIELVTPEAMDATKR